MISLKTPALLALVLCAAAAGCSSSGSVHDAPPVPKIDPVRPAPLTTEVRAHAAPYVDAPYDAEEVTQYRTPAALPDLDVRALAVTSSAVYAGTPSGLFEKRHDASRFTTSGGITGAVIDLAVAAGDTLVVLQEGFVRVRSELASQDFAVSGEKPAAVTMHGARVYVGTDKGVSSVDAGGLTPLAGTQGTAVRDLAVQGDVLWMATATGVRRFDFAASAMLPDLHAPALLADEDVRALWASSDGTEVLAATANGLSRIAASGVTATLHAPGLNSLPNADLRAVASSAGEVLTGHGIGATAWKGTHRAHYHSQRWIPAEEITAVALGPDRTRWLGTRAGISGISLIRRTLAQKADAFEPLVDRHLRVDGFVDDGVSYADPYDLTSAPRRNDDDNDGLWTELNIAGWCMAYQVTKNERYYQRARKSLDTVNLLIDVPGDTFEAAGKKRGFVARSVVRDDEKDVFTEKATKTNWHLQEHGGRSYYWKDDTSSDEYAGHFFGMPLFYDLCAKTDDERAAIRDRIALIAGYIVDNGYLLIGLNGEPTRFGRWKDLSSAVDGLGPCIEARKETCFDSYGGGGWLNTLEILGHLLAAWHVTGDPRFYDAYQDLAVTQRYAEMVPLTDHTLTVTDPEVQNHSDHELAILSYFTLLRYEPNPERRAIWLKSLLEFYATERVERNALEIAIVSSATRDDVDLAAGAGTLAEWPEDWRKWKVDNTHRKDAVLNAKNDRFKEPQFLTVFPYGEIRTMEWNGNAHAVSGGGDGKEVQAPWPWLLPYWMMRYTGAITAR